MKDGHILLFTMITDTRAKACLLICFGNSNAYLKQFEVFIHQKRKCIHSCYSPIIGQPYI